MMRETKLASLNTLRAFIFTRSTAATLKRIAELPKGRWDNTLVTDGYDVPITLAASVTISEGSVHVDFAGTSPMSRRGINVPLIYTKAHA